MINIRKDSVLFRIKSLDKSIVKCILNSNIPLIQPTQMEIIAYILENKNKKVYQKDLEKVLHLSRATVSSVLITMEKNNLIKRITDSNDLRSKQVILNSDAKNMFSKAKEKIMEINNTLTKGLSREEVNLFLNVIDKMRDNIDSYKTIK